MCHSVSFDASLNTKVKWNVAKGKVREMKKWREVLWKCKKKKRKTFFLWCCSMKKTQKMFFFVFVLSRSWFLLVCFCECFRIEGNLFGYPMGAGIGTHWKSSWKFKWKTLKIFYALGWEKKEVSREIMNRRKLRRSFTWQRVNHHQKRLLHYADRYMYEYTREKPSLRAGFLYTLSSQEKTTVGWRVRNWEVISELDELKAIFN